MSWSFTYSVSYTEQYLVFCTVKKNAGVTVYLIFFFKCIDFSNLHSSPTPCDSDQAYVLLSSMFPTCLAISTGLS